MKTSAFDEFAKELSLGARNGPVFMACKILGLSDEKAEAIAMNSGAWELESSKPASNFKSTAQWGNAQVHKVAILTRYL